MGTILLRGFGLSQLELIILFRSPLSSVLVNSNSDAQLVALRNFWAGQWHKDGEKQWT